MLNIFANGISAVKRNAVTLFYSCEKWNRVCSYVSVKAYVSVKSSKKQQPWEGSISHIFPIQVQFQELFRYQFDLQPGCPPKTRSSSLSLPSSFKTIGSLVEYSSLGVPLMDGFVRVPCSCRFIQNLEHLTATSRVL